MGIFCKLEYSCCGCELRFGSSIVGVFYAVFSVLEVIYTAILTNEYHSMDESLSRLVLVSVLIYSVIFALVFLILNVLLVFGCWQEDPSYIFPWLVFRATDSALQAVALLSLFICGFVYSQTDIVVGSSIAAGFLVVKLYLMAVVCSYYRRLSSS